MTSMPHALLLPSLLLLALAAGPSLAACSSSEDARQHPDPISTYGVVREGDASDAQLNTFLQHKARDWDWAGGVFDAPDDQATVDADPPLTFAWHADPAELSPGSAAGEVVITHLLLFSAPTHPSLLKVFTTRPDYTPNAQAWQTLLDAGEPITVSLTTGTFVGSDLPEEGGPFSGQALTFTIE